MSGADRQEQITFLTDLLNPFAAQVKQINEHLAGMEPRIFAVQHDKQEMDVEGNHLNRNLKVAEETCTALARKVEGEKITSQNTGSGVGLASRSVVPEASSCRGLFIPAVAMMLPSYYPYLS